MAYHFDKIILDVHLQYDDESHQSTFVVQGDGACFVSAGEIGKEAAGRELCLTRGEVFRFFELASQYEKIKSPILLKPLEEGSYVAMYLFKDGVSLYCDPEDGKPLPALRTERPALYHRGNNLIGIFFQREPTRPRIFAADILEELFDIAIPYGYEVYPLSEIDFFASLATKEMEKNAKAFLDDLIEGGEGLPPLSDDFRTFLDGKRRQIQEGFREHCRHCAREADMVEAAFFLREHGYNFPAKDYLELLANENNGLACQILAEWCYCDGDEVNGTHFATRGVGVGNGRCCYLLAKRRDNMGLDSEAKRLAERGARLDDADCCAFLAKHIYDNRDNPDSPYCDEDPFKTALAYAERGAELGSPKAMVQCGRIYSHASDYAEVAFQWLTRAEEHGEKEAYYELAKFHAKGKGKEKDLFLAEHYIKKAIQSNKGNTDKLELSYAYILLLQGKIPEMMKKLETLSKNGFKKADAALGRLACGRYQDLYPCDHPIPEEFINALRKKDEFYAAAAWRIRPDLMPADKAASILGRLAKQGEFLAFYELANIYREGPKEMRDEKKAEMFDANFDKYAAKAGVLPKIETV